MKYIAVLDMDNVTLAELECRSVLDRKIIFGERNIRGFASIDARHLSRLTYTKYVAKILQSCDPKQVHELLKQWEARSCLVFKQKGDTRVSSLACKKAFTKNASKPAMIVVCTQEKAYLGEILFENDKSFLKRHPKLRPAHHPATILPKLARAAINCSGAKSGTILDPLCGVGGIVIEAAILGFEAHGSDINDTMLAKAKINIEHYDALYTTMPTIAKQDVLTLTTQADAIVSDLPYSKTTTKIDDLESFYTKCLTRCATCSSRAVFMFPDFTPNEKIIRESGWKIVARCTYYLHRSLSKEIFILTR